jgi:NAD(P)-dependent dehydrogenase (short-subunit alcohol dehydrogenase family)
MAPLANSRVLILGGSSGIGYGVAQAALAEGATVIIASSTKNKVDAAAVRLGNSEKVIAEQAEITSEESIKSLFERVGELDHLVITVGDFRPPLSTCSNYDDRLVGYSSITHRPFWRRT